MSAATRALLSGLIDYAGLFPPAGLPMNRALENHAGYRRGPDHWALNRFVVPARRLAEFGDLLGAMPGGVLALGALVWLRRRA